MPRYFAETECEHGQMESHYTCEMLSKLEYQAIEHDETHYCPGGSRRELTLNMVAVIDHLIEEFAITDMVDRDTLLVHAYDMEKAALSAEPGDIDD